MIRRVKVLDTTLRDGEQSPGCSMSIREKLKLAVQLEKLGVDIIEAGFAASSDAEMKSIKEISKIITNAEVASLARTKKEDIDKAYEAVKDAKKPRINMFLATSEIHLKYKLKITEEECLNQIKESVTYAKSLCKTIQFCAEDASRTSTEFLKKVYMTAVKAGATAICISDTVGYLMPEDTENIVKYLIKNIKSDEKIDISIHAHNDLGLAVANTIAAVKAGATQIECTINGIGERAGNASLEEAIMILSLREDTYKCKTNINVKQIYETSKILSSVIKAEPSANKPLVGKNAFRHEAGVHQHGILANRATYELIPSKTIGLEEQPFVLGKHSGKTALKIRLNGIGIKLKKAELEEFNKTFKKFADRKTPVTDTELKHLYNEEKRKKVRLEKERIKIEKEKLKLAELKNKEKELKK